MFREMTQLLNRLVEATEAGDDLLVLKLARKYARLSRQCASPSR